MSHILTLARMTFREAVRRRIVLAGLVLGACFVIIFSVGFHIIIVQINHVTSTTDAIANGEALQKIAATEGQNTLVLLGLYAVTFLSIAMAALLGADTLSGEISSGTIQTIVTKPIPRSAVVLGKWLGFAILLGLYILLLAGGTILSVFIQTGYLPNNLSSGLALIYMEALLIMTISLTCSSAFPALATGGIVFGLYGLAFLGGWIEQFGTIIQNPTAVKLGILVSLIIPSESLWRRAAYEMQTPLAGALGVSPFGTTSIPSPLMIIYAVIYLMLTLMLGIRIFKNRDL